MLDSLLCRERKPVRSHAGSGVTRWAATGAVVSSFRQTYQSKKRRKRIRIRACKSTWSRHATTVSGNKSEKLLALLSDCNQEMLLPPLHRWCVFSLSTSPRHPSLPLLPSSVLSLSLSICESAYPSTPLSLSFFSLISFILTTTNFQLVKHTHTHCHLFRNNVE